MNEEQELINEIERPPEIPSANEINLQRAEESRMRFEEETSHLVDNTTTSYAEGFDVNTEDLNNVSFGENDTNNE